MNEKELRERFAPRKVESQIEFERIMSDMNAEQTRMNRPYMDSEYQIGVRRQTLKQQVNSLNQQITTLNLELMQQQNERKQMNRLFHDLKHELIMMNPIEDFARREADEDEETIDIF